VGGERADVAADAIANLFHAPLICVTSLALPIRRWVANLNDHDPAKFAKPSFVLGDGEA
jgi:hypothetical protein